MHALQYSIFREQGTETRPTFFLRRKLEKPDHIDYVFVSKEFINGLKKMGFGKVRERLKTTDHLPIICEFETEKNNDTPTP